MPEPQPPTSQGDKASPGPSPTATNFEAHEASTPPRQPFSAQLGQLLGAIGIVLLMSAPLTFLLADVGPLFFTKLAAGTLLLAIYAISNRHQRRQRRGGKSGAFLAVSASTTAVVVGLVAAANYFVATHDHEFDLTREKLFTLSAQTQESLAHLSAPVDVYAFVASQEPSFGPIQEALDRYATLSPMVRVHMVDPQSRPDLVSKYAITERGPRIVWAAGGRDARAKGHAEDELTGALLKVVGQSERTIYFLQGHGEGDITDSEQAEGFASLAQAITTDGYKVDTLNLIAGQPQEGDDANVTEPAAEAAPLSIPATVDVLAVVAPMHKILAPEVQAIATYLEQGGRVLVLEESRADSGLTELLGRWRVQVQNDLIVDTNPVGRLMGLGVASPIIQPVEQPHPLLRGIHGAIMTTARSLAIKAADANTVPGVEAVALMKTGDTAWGETQLAQGSTIGRDESDHLPPLYTALAAERQIPPAPTADANGPIPAGPRGARLVVFGDSDWANNRLLRLQSNEDLALNALGWLTEQDDKVTIRPNVRVASQLYLTGDQLGSLKFLSMDIVPVLLVAMGLGIVLMRRQR